jgi:MICOS complex subunit MIC26
VYNNSQVQVQSAISKWIGLEEVVEREPNHEGVFWSSIDSLRIDRVKSIIPKDETFTPGILYIGVAALAGSIFARSRKCHSHFSSSLPAYSAGQRLISNHLLYAGSLPVRVLLPPTLFILAFPQFLPKTSANLQGYFGSLEDAYTPSVAVQHDALKKSLHDAFVEAWKSYEKASSSTKEGVQGTLKKVEEWSGLKLGADEKGKRDSSSP